MHCECPNAESRPADVHFLACSGCGKPRAGVAIELCSVSAPAEPLRLAVTEEDMITKDTVLDMLVKKDDAALLERWSFATPEMRTRLLRHLHSKCVARNLRDGKTQAWRWEVVLQPCTR